jgi:hypothetical protein
MDNVKETECIRSAIPVSLAAAETRPTAFEKEAAKQSDGSLIGEFWFFLKTNKKWWLLPILIALLALGLIMVLATTAAAPFIYTLF